MGLYQAFEIRRVDYQDGNRLLMDVTFRPLTKKGFDAPTSAEALEKAMARWPRFGRRIAIGPFHGVRRDHVQTPADASGGFRPLHVSGRGRGGETLQ